MKIRRSLCLLLTLFLLFSAFVVPVQAEEAGAPSVSQGCSTLDAQVSFNAGEQLLDTSKAAILYEMTTDTLVYGWNPDLPVDPSGMNKIMTALLAIERGDPDTVVTVSRAALESVGIGSVSAGLKAGEEISLRDLLYCMMVGSANDAAAVIAEHIGGSQAGFVGFMNERAMELGCTNTQFMNPNGLSHEGQYSTARDLAKITRAALEVPLFVELFGAVSYTVPATNESEERQIVTTNYLMSKETVRNQFDERVTGGKTGALSTTDRSLIGTASDGELQFLTVIMSAKGTVTANGLSVKTFGSFEETRALLDHGFDGFSVRQLLQQRQVMGQFPVSDGENDVIGRPAEDLYVVLPNDATEMDFSYNCVTPPSGIQAPLVKDQSIGSVEVWFRGVCVGQCDMVAMFGVDKPGVHNISLLPTAEAVVKRAWTTWLLIGGIVLLAILLICGAVLLVKRKIRIAKIERRHKIIRGEGKGSGPKVKTSKGRR